MDKLKLGELGERLKASGAKMGRMVSEKMKEIMQTPTPESMMVDEATLETLEDPNYGMNLRICTMINSEEFSGSEVVRAIKRKLSGRNVVSQRLSLDLLEDCTVNCEKVSSEVASEKVLDEMMRLIDDPQSDNGNRVRAMQLIRAWGESEELAYLPVFRQTYMNLKERGATSIAQEGNSREMQYDLESYVHQPLSPPDRYPVPDTGSHDADGGALPFHFRDLSLEETKDFIVVTRNSVELLSTILNSETEPKPLKEELTLSMLEKCKESQPVIKGIIERTTDDEGLLFEALYLHDELQQIISKYEALEASLKPEVEQQLENSDSTLHEEELGETAKKLGESSSPPKFDTEVEKLEDAKEHSREKQPENTAELNPSSQLGSEKETKVMDSQKGGEGGSSQLSSNEKKEGA